MFHGGYKELQGLKRFTGKYELLLRVPKGYRKLKEFIKVYRVLKGVTDR